MIQMKFYKDIGSKEKDYLSDKIRTAFDLFDEK